MIKEFLKDDNDDKIVIVKARKKHVIKTQLVVKDRQDEITRVCFRTSYCYCDKCNTEVVHRLTSQYIECITCNHRITFTDETIEDIINANEKNAFLPLGGIIKKEVLSLFII